MNETLETNENGNCANRVLAAVCHSCGHALVKKEIREDNGEIGGGFASWVVDSWYQCNSCGARFNKLIPQKSCIGTLDIGTNKWRKAIVFNSNSAIMEIKRRTTDDDINILTDLLSGYINEFDSVLKNLNVDK